MVNALDLLRAMQVPRSDRANCSKTLLELVHRYGLTVGRDSFKSPGCRQHRMVPSVTLRQMIELILVLPGEYAARVRKAVAIVFATWLGASQQLVQITRARHGIDQPFKMLRQIVEGSREVITQPRKPRGRQGGFSRHRQLEREAAALRSCKAHHSSSSSNVFVSKRRLAQKTGPEESLRLVLQPLNGVSMDMSDFRHVALALAI